MNLQGLSFVLHISSIQMIYYYVIEIQCNEDELILILKTQNIIYGCQKILYSLHYINILYFSPCNRVNKLLFIITVQLRCTTACRIYTRWSPASIECEFYNRDLCAALYNCFYVRFSMNRDRSSGRGSNMLIGITRDIVKERRVQPSYNRFKLECSLTTSSSPSRKKRMQL